MKEVAIRIQDMSLCLNAFCISSERATSKSVTNVSSKYCREGFTGFLGK